MISPLSTIQDLVENEAAVKVTNMKLEAKRGPIRLVVELEEVGGSRSWTWEIDAGTLNKKDPDDAAA